MNRMTLTACVVAAAAVVTTGCGSSGGGSGGGGEAKSEAGGKSIPITIVADETGAAGFAGAGVAEGIKVGEEEVNSSGVLGKNKLDITIEDSASVESNAVNMVSKAGRSSALAVGYALLSTGAAATAPIAQREKIPYVEISADAPNLLNVGDYIFHATAPPEGYQEPQAQYWKEQGVKSLAVIYDSDNPSYTTMAKEKWGEIAPKFGIKIVAEEPIKTTDTEFAAVVSQVVAAKPGAILMGALGNQTPTLVTQLERAGYKGKVGLTDGSAVYTLPALKAAGNGITFPTGYSPVDTSDKSVAEFTETYKKATGKTPQLFEAFGYDGVQFIAAAVKDAPSLTREGLKAGMEKVWETGYEGAEGKVTFGPGSGGSHDALAPGLAVEWSWPGEGQKIVARG